MEQRGRETLDRFAETVIRFRVPIIVCIVALAGVCAYFYNKIPRDMSVEAMVLEDDPDLQSLRKFKDVFGNDEFIILAAKLEDIFTIRVMSEVEALRAKLEDGPRIKQATAFTNVRHVRGGEGAIIVEPLVAEIPEDDAGVAEIRRRAMSETDFINNFYSTDGKTLSILLRLEAFEKGEDSTETRTGQTATACTAAAASGNRPATRRARRRPGC